VRFSRTFAAFAGPLCVYNIYIIYNVHRRHPLYIIIIIVVYTLITKCKHRTALPYRRISRCWCSGIYRPIVLYKMCIASCLRLSLIFNQLQKSPDPIININYVHYSERNRYCLFSFIIILYRCRIASIVLIVLCVITYNDHRFRAWRPFLTSL